MLRRLVPAVAISIAGTLALAGPAGSTTQQIRDCGDTVRVGAGAYNVQAIGNIGCTKARRVAKAYFHGNEILGFTCSDRQIGEELFRARCARPNAWVKFAFGA